MKRPEQIGEIKRVGGWRGSPNSLAALAWSRPSIADHKKCKRCRTVAIRGEDYCRMHIGRRSPLSLAGGRGESRILGRLERAGLLPLELLALPLWRNLNGIETGKRAPTRLSLVQAWDKRFTAPLHWSQVQRQAIELGARPGKRQNTAWWYENG